MEPRLPCICGRRALLVGGPSVLSRVFHLNSEALYAAHTARLLLQEGPAAFLFPPFIPSRNVQGGRGLGMPLLPAGSSLLKKRVFWKGNPVVLPLNGLRHSMILSKFQTQSG